MNDALFNAALLGFTKVMGYDLKSTKYIDGTELVFPQSDLEYFSAKYIVALLDRLKHQTPLAYIYQKRKQFQVYIEKGSRETDGGEGSPLRSPKSDTAKRSENKNADRKKMEKKGLEFSDLVVKKFESDSYKAAIEILTNKGIPFDITQKIAEIKKLKKEKESFEMLRHVLQLLEEIEMTKIDVLKTGSSHLDDVPLYAKDYFLIKDIIYNNVKEFWNGIAFLHTQKNKSDYVEVLKESFQSKAEVFVEANAKKTSIHCSQCNSAMTKTQAENMSWLNDMGVDIARKHSYYWNCSPDIVLCPICKLVYSCLPLGFSVVGKSAVFVNDNASFQTLSDGNQTFSFEESGNLYYEVLKQFIVKKLEKDQESIYRNIQVVWRSESRYRLFSFSPDLIKKLYRCRKYFESIEKIAIELDGNRISVFEEAFVRVMNGVRLDGFIQRIIRQKLKEPEMRVGFVSHLIMINAAVFLKGGMPMSNKQADEKKSRKSTQVDEAKEQGRVLYHLMVGKKPDLKNNPEGNINTPESSDAAVNSGIAESSEKRIRGLSYRLLNAVSLNNTELFIDAIARQYLSMSRPIPEIISQMLKSEEDFIRIGHSFILGLNSAGETLKIQDDESFNRDDSARE